MRPGESRLTKQDDPEKFRLGEAHPLAGPEHTTNLNEDLWWNLQIAHQRGFPKIRTQVTPSVGGRLNQTEQPPPPPPPRRTTYDFAVASYTPANGAVTISSTVSGSHRFFIPELTARYPTPDPDPAPAPVPDPPPPPPPAPAPVPPPPSPAHTPGSDESDPEEDEYESDGSWDIGSDVDYIPGEPEAGSPVLSSDVSDEDEADG